MEKSFNRPSGGADSEPARIDWEAVIQWSEDNVFEMICDARGDLNPKKSNKSEWRWGSHGSLRLYRDHLNYVDDECGTKGSAFKGVGYALGWPGTPWSKAETLRYVLERMGQGYRYDPVKRADRQQKVKADLEKRPVEKLVKAVEFIGRTQHLDGTPGETYWKENRRNRRAPDCLRYLPNAMGRYGALVAIATDQDGNLTGGQRIFIDEHGNKAPLDTVKASFGVLRGSGVVMQRRADAILPDVWIILGEGPETCGSAWTVTGVRTLACLGNRFADAPVSPGSKIIILRDADRLDKPIHSAISKEISRLVERGHTVVEAWPDRSYLDKKGTDFNDLAQREPDADDIIRRIILDAAALELSSPIKGPEPKHTPHFPLWDQNATAAYLELQILLEDWVCQTERYLDARDYASDQRSAFMHDGMSKSERRDLTRNIDREVSRRYPGVDLKRPPRLQIAAAAGLGKSSGFRSAYLRHPKLWNRHLHAFMPTVALGRDFEKAMNTAMEGMMHRPLVALHRGRDHEADIDNAPCQRWRAGRKLSGKVGSLFSAMCKNGESICRHFSNCEYIRSYQNQSPGLHIFAHENLSLNKPLNFPRADMAVIDEDATQVLLSNVTIGASVLSERDTYQTAAITNEQDDAVKLGSRLLTAISSGAPLLAAIRSAGITRKDLRVLAAWAEPVSNGPEVTPSMTDAAIEAIADRLQPQHGEIVARIARQLDRELRHGRDIAHGVLYADQTIRLMRHKRVTAITKGIPLLIIDADADLETNRRLFGKTLAGREIRARRKGRVVQISNAALGKSYLIPDVVFGKEAAKFQVDRAVALRSRIREWITGKSLGGKKVLVVTNKPVRRVFTGEPSGKIPLSIEMHGATWTHYGAILGVDEWKHYDVVILLGREEVGAGTAEQQARAIFCDDPEPISFSGQYTKVERCHRLRDGSAVPASVYVHEDARVQRRTEARRERGIGQAIDRLRLIHGRDDREVFILCNLPVPGVEVDQMMSLRELLSGGSPAEKLVSLAKTRWGVLPLVPAFLVQYAPEIATSERTAKRIILEIKRAKPEIESCFSFGPFKSVRFWRLKQRRPSEVLFFGDLQTKDSIAALERQVGTVTVQMIGKNDEDVSEEVPETVMEPGACEPDMPEPIRPVLAAAPSARNARKAVSRVMELLPIRGIYDGKNHPMTQSTLNNHVCQSESMLE